MECLVPEYLEEWMSTAIVNHILHSTSVYGWVESLDPSSQHLRSLGDIGNITSAAAS